MAQDQKPGEKIDPITENLGGVQGTEGGAPIAKPSADADPAGDHPDEPAPNAGEIEWAGGLITRPPSP